MIRGLWDFMALLDLNEEESDSVIEEMLDYVTFCQELKAKGHHHDTEDNLDFSSFVPVRIQDADACNMKIRLLLKAKTAS